MNPPDRTRSAPPATGFAGLLVAGGLALAVGLIGDLARHVLHPAAEPDGPLDGWHPVLWAAAGVTALFLVVTLIRHGLRTLRTHATAFVGVLLVLLAAPALRAWPRVADETTRLETLVSPPHLLAFGGTAAVLITPVLLVGRVRSPRLGWADAVTVWVPMIALVVLVNLLTGYASALVDGVEADLGSLPASVGRSVGELDIARGLASILWLTVTITAAHAAASSRWRPPAGVVLLGFVALAAVPPIFAGWEDGRAVSAGLVVAGVVVEISTAAHARPTLGPLAGPFTFALAAVVSWSTTFLVIDGADELVWSTTLALGSVLMAGIAAAGTALLVQRPTPSPSAPATVGYGNRAGRPRIDDPTDPISHIGAITPVAAVDQPTRGPSRSARRRLIEATDDSPRTR